MKAFWKDIGRLTVVGLAIVGVLCLLGVASFWAAIAGLLVLDIIVIARLNRPKPQPQIRPISRFGPRHMFLN